MITTVLIISIVFTALLQQRVSRFVVALCFAVPCAALDYFGSSITNDSMYYICSGICSIIMIILISMVNPMTWQARKLQDICVAAIVVNAAGWVAYMLYITPVFYNYAMIALYALSLYVLLTRDRDNVGGRRVDWWRSGVFKFDIPRGLLDTQSKEADRW